MNKKGFVGPILFYIAAVVITGIVLDASFDLEKNEGQKYPRITATELTQKNGKTIWCKMKGRTDCDISAEVIIE